MMMRVAIGEEAAWSKMQIYCETWYELLAGWLFFTNPTVKTYELGRLAKRCIATTGARNHMRHLDVVLLAAMEVDIIQASGKLKQFP